jgi:hypothetical protein
MLPRILNHLLCYLLCFESPGRMYHSKESTQGGTLNSSTQVWSTCHTLGVVDYKALTRLSLLRVPHFHARRGASLKDLNPDTMSVSKTKCFLIDRWNTRKHTNVGKPLQLWKARVIYRFRYITHRAITTNKRDQVMVTMHASKLKTKYEQNISLLETKLDSKSLKKGKDTRAHRSLRLLQELEWRLDSTLVSRQGFTYATTTKLEPLQVEKYK